VDHHYDQSVNFAGLKTFDWLPDDAISDKDKRIVAHVKKEVEKQLSAKGISRTLSNPDMFADIHGESQEKWSPARHVKHREGSLAIEFIDPQTNKQIWIGTATHIFDQEPASDEELAKLIDEAITKVLENFPPKQG
jgi:hypothetical protein